MRCATDRTLRPGRYGYAILAGFVVILLAVTWFAGETHSARAKSDERYGADVVGDTLSDWSDLRFLDEPHQREPEEFAGRVLILRWWTAGCPFCETSAPVLSDWAKQHAEDDLTVIGIFHPKPPRRVKDQEVRELAGGLGLECLLAVDDDWSVLEKLWLKEKRRAYTSASLLVDRQGVVRAVHRGGYLTPEGSKEDQLAYQAFADSLEVVLAENEEGAP
jgi:thiol-disulfide isomerase/thioredoxin